MSAAWIAKLADKGQLLSDEPMSRHTTLGVGGGARWFFRPDNRQALGAVLQIIPSEIALLPLGRGSNLLIPDHGFDGMVIDLGKLNAMHAQDGQIHAEAGVRMSKLARFAAEQGLAGLEFMATVPGDVGGGIVMNAGAFSQQVSDTLAGVDIVSRNGKCAWLPAADMSMSYRHTKLPPGCFVVQAVFSMRTDNTVAIRSRMREMRKWRSETQPLTQPNCGSVFKNPPGHHAAKLIELAGLKGLKIGHACISDKHANFIVNEGGAKSSDIIELIRRAQQEVRHQFGVHLEPEVQTLGEAR